ncbi:MULTISPECIES: hypothetical protein [unclassified Luteimonas]
MRRIFYIALAVGITALVILFKIQNLSAVTVSLFSVSITMPTAILIFLVYVLGMVTGGLVLTLLRAVVHGATRPSPQHL